MRRQGLLGCLIGVLAASAAWGQVVPSSPDFQVNTITTSGQASPWAAAGPDGKFLIVWGSFSSIAGDDEPPSVRGQRFSSLGVPLSTEFQINTITSGSQRNPKSAICADGSSLITWSSESSTGDDTSDSSIQMRRYASDGTALSSDLQVNSYTTDTQSQPMATCRTDGSFVLAWASRGSAGSDDDSFGIQARLVDSSGLPQGADFQVNTYTTGGQTSTWLSSAPDRSFVVVWSSDSASGDPGFSVQARRFTSDGSAIGDQFRVNTYTTLNQLYGSIDSGPDGSFVVVWQSETTPTDSYYAIVLQRYASNGSALGTEMQVNTYTTGAQAVPSVDMRADGSFVVAWQNGETPDRGSDDKGIRARRFSSDGSALGADFQVNTYTPGVAQSTTVAAAAGDVFLVAWQNTGSPGNDSAETSILARRFGPFVPLQVTGSDFQVNTYTSGNQFRSAVSRHTDGSFTIAWDSAGSAGDTDGTSVAGQRYDSDGNPDGAEFLVNTYTTGNQFNQKVAHGLDGSFLVVWQSVGSSGSDGSSLSIQSRFYDSDGAPAGADLQVNTFTTGAQTEPAVDGGTDGSFVAVWRSGSPSGTDPSGSSIRGQRLDASGQPSGLPFQANTYTTGDQERPDVSAGPGGSFVVVWQGEDSSGGDTLETSIQAQRFESPETATGAQFQVNTYTTGRQLHPKVGLGPDGSFVVVWESYESAGNDPFCSIQGQRFASDGAPIAAQFQVNTYTTEVQFEPDVSVNPDGSFLVVWAINEDEPSPTDHENIRGRLFGPDGASLGADFQVNTYTTGDQSQVSVSTGPGGGVVSWTSEDSAGTDHSGFSVQARLLALAPTSTPTATPTAEPTSTPTSTAEATFTSTPTSTATPTSTFDPTAPASQTPTLPAGQTPTATATPTAPAPVSLGVESGLAVLVVLLLAGLFLAAVKRSAEKNQEAVQEFDSTRG